MYEYTMKLHAKLRMEEFSRATARRHWLRDLLTAQKADRAARKDEQVQIHTERSQYE